MFVKLSTLSVYHCCCFDDSVPDLLVQPVSKSISTDRLDNETNMETWLSIFCPVDLWPWGDGHKPLGKDRKNRRTGVHILQQTMVNTVPKRTDDIYFLPINPPPPHLFLSAQIFFCETLAKHFRIVIFSFESCLLGDPQMLKMYSILFKFNRLASNYINSCSNV